MNRVGKKARRLLWLRLLLEESMIFFACIPILTIIRAEWKCFQHPGYRSFHYETSFAISWLAMQALTIAWMVIFREIPPAPLF